MKKRFLMLGMLLITITVMPHFFTKTVKLPSQCKKAHALVAPTARARTAYCQIMGDRVGCKEDASRSCTLDVFCN